MHRLWNGRILWQATSNALRGVWLFFRNERAAQQEGILFLLLLPWAFLLAEGRLEWLLLVGSLLFVLVVEMLNTAIEKTVDRISKEQHPLSATIKDISAGAVFLAILFALLTWFLMLW